MADPLSYPFAGIAIAVPAHPDQRLLDGVQKLQRLNRQRPLHHVTAHHDKVGTRAGHVREHRFKRPSVAVNVIQGGDPHRDTIPGTTEPTERQKR